MMNYHATSDWNALDEEIITSESLKKFKFVLGLYFNDCPILCQDLSENHCM